VVSLLSLLVWMAFCGTPDATGNGSEVAPARIQALMALEVSEEKTAEG
jgi:hypothetical protein